MENQEEALELDLTPVPDTRYNFNNPDIDTPTIPPDSKPKSKWKKHFPKILAGSLVGALSITGIAIGVSQCAPSPVVPTPTPEGAYKINLGQSEHCQVSIQKSKTEAKPNEKVVIEVSNVESGYDLICSSLNDS